MTAKFGFQVTVQDCAIWIFPEDIDAAALAAKAEAKVTEVLMDELKAKGKAELEIVVNKLPPTVKKEAEKEIEALKAAGKDDLEATAIALANKVSDVATTLGNDAKDRLEDLKAKANAGVVYGWTRSPGEDPIELGTFLSLTEFIDKSIIGSLPDVVRPTFSVTDSFQSLVGGLPDPMNSALGELTSTAKFELDGIRIKIPGKGSTEKTQFEIAMLVNLVNLQLKLGPFRANRLYAKMGNFDAPASEPTTPTA
ncbi:MAG: hypothetical protein WA939_23145 [Nodosilinea sp.]